MCGGGAQDNSDKVAQIEANSAEKARQAAAAEQARKEAAFEQNLGGAYQSAITDAQNYFKTMGLDPNEYIDQISSAANSKRSAVPQLDSNPGTYFSGLGSSVYNDATLGKQNRFLNDIDRYAGTGFERKLISDQADDPFLAQILDQKYNEADTQLNNQKARGVLTDGGLAAALAEINRQKATAGNTLDTLGQSILEQGRGNLRNIAADARTGASNYKLGGTFDPFSFQGDINNKTSDFLSKLGDQLQGVAPSDLFDVSKAFGKGGVTQGAGNGEYDPNASAGIFSLFDDAQKNKKNKPESAYSASPF